MVQERGFKEASFFFLWDNFVRKKVSRSSTA